MTRTKWVAASVLLFVQSIAWANLLVNPSFELGSFNNSDPDPRPEIMLVPQGAANIAGWSVQGPGGVHWIFSTSVSYAGSYYLDLQGEIATPLSSVSQSFETIAGAEYELAFHSFPGSAGALNTGTVSVGSLQNQSFLGDAVPGSPSQSSYTPFLFRFIATDTTSTLVFRTTKTNGFGPIIDNVSVVPVPEPATAVLMAVGLAALSARCLRVRGEA